MFVRSLLGVVSSVTSLGSRAMGKASPWPLVSPPSAGRFVEDVDVIARRLVAEKQRLEREEEAAEERLLKLQSESARIHKEMNTEFARILRVRRQRRLVETKGVDMIRRGLNSMDELESVERAEAFAEESSHIDGTFVDWSTHAQDLSWEALGLGEFVGDSSSGVAETSQGVQ